jgi:carbamoyl-phosphate synthase/aspartate carbamoyltransferase/dihydroorotase/carbamoyl-phosphate synthase/aspartate carbamoyltransferase
MNYDVSFRYVSPDSLRLPLGLVNELIDKGFDVREDDRVENVIDDVDVLYVTRIQKERFTDMVQYELVKDYFEITTDVMKKAKNNMIIMHPLPRVGEIHYDVDADPRAAYFRQVKNGMLVRMALLASVLGQA